MCAKNPRLKIVPIVAVLFCIGQIHWAAILSVSPTPSGKNVPLSRSVSVPINWLVSTTTGPFVSSSSGTFAIPAGPTLGTVPISLTVPAAAGSTVTLSEVVLIPTGVIHRAHKLGSSSFQYTRLFTDGGVPPSPLTGTVTLHITGSTGAGFAISRFSLHFENREPVRIISHREPLQAEAEILFSGSGILKGNWELATPASTLGEPVFLTLQTVRKQLTASRKIVLPAPELPTENAGLYSLRFEISEPATEFESPIIRYFVQEDRATSPTKIHDIVQPIELQSPPHLANIATDTRFAWAHISGTHVYQVEFYQKRIGSKKEGLGDTASAGSVVTLTDPLTKRAATGVLVPANQTDIALSVITQARLEPGKVYLWRVVSYSEDGVVLGESPLREIYIPKTPN